MTPLIIKVINDIINRYLKLGYAVGKGFVLGKDEVLKQFDQLQLIVRGDIASVMRGRVEQSRLDVLRSLCGYTHT